MGNLFDFLMLILSVIDISVFGNWVQMLERYRVYVSEEESCSMPDNVLGFYRHGVGRWGVHMICVDAGLPDNLKTAVLLHEYSHFVEFINNKSKNKRKRDNIASHNSEWKSIYSELLYSAYSAGFLSPNGLEKEMMAFNLHPYDLAIMSHILGISTFGEYDFLDEDEALYHEIWNLEMESPGDSYEDEDMDPNY